MLVNLPNRVVSNAIYREFQNLFIAKIEGVDMLVQTGVIDIGDDGKPRADMMFYQIPVYDPCFNIFSDDRGGSVRTVPADVLTSLVNGDVDLGTMAKYSKILMSIEAIVSTTKPVIKEYKPPIEIHI